MALVLQSKASQGETKVKNELQEFDLKR